MLASAPMITLYGSPRSTATRLVRATLHQLATPHEFVAIDFARGEHKAPAHLARQPFGQVPALDDDGFVLYESRAIVRYLDARAGGPLTPPELRARGLMEQWMSVEHANFTPHAMKFVYHELFGRAQAPEVLAEARAKLAVACDVLDAALRGRAFLAGDQLSLADLAFAPYVDYLLHTAGAAAVRDRAALAAWWGRVAALPAWQATIAG